MVKKKFDEFELNQKNPVYKRPNYDPENFPEWFSEDAINVKEYSPDRPTDYMEKARFLVASGYPVYTTDIMELASWLEKNDE